MEVVNNSPHYVNGHVYSGFPHSQANRAAVLGNIAPGNKTSADLDAGPYYVVLTTTDLGSDPPLTIAASGGVPAAGTVTLSKDDRIEIR